MVVFFLFLVDVWFREVSKNASAEKDFRPNSG